MEHGLHAKLMQWDDSRSNFCLVKREHKAIIRAWNGEHGLHAKQMQWDELRVWWGNAMVQVACCWLHLAGKCDGPSGLLLGKCDGPSGLLLVAFGGEIQWSKWLAAGCVQQGNAMVQVACCWLREEHQARV